MISRKIHGHKLLSQCFNESVFLITYPFFFKIALTKKPRANPININPQTSKIMLSKIKDAIMTVKNSTLNKNIFFIIFTFSLLFPNDISIPYNCFSIYTLTRCSSVVSIAIKSPSRICSKVKEGIDGLSMT